LPGLIHRIPLASLAGILILVGYRLASPRVFIETYKKGWDQIVIFSVTVVLTIVEDLLVGVACGILTAIIIQFSFGVPFKSMFIADLNLEKENDEYIVFIRHALLFSNMISLKVMLSRIPLGKKITFKFEKVKMVGFSAIEFLKNFKRDYELRSGTVIYDGFDQMKPIADYAGATRIQKVN
jgi:MFS superfamily sulfate permease-like transporter